MKFAETYIPHHMNPAAGGKVRMAKAKPRLLDLFCCAGGAGMGYYRAGFEVVGVDIKPQPRYPFEFVQADALEYVKEHGREFDAIHASPPCQGFCDLKSMYNAKAHADLLTPTREILRSTGKPFVIENVEGAPLFRPILLCGSMFKLKVAGAELRRHRLFESDSVFVLTPPCSHGQEERVIGVYGGHGRDRRRRTNTQNFSVEHRRQAMGIDWMNGNELSQAIPPAYTEFIGKQLLEALQ